MMRCPLNGLRICWNLSHQLRISTGARENGLTYNRFIQGIKAAGIEVDRRILSDLATNDPAAFAALVEIAKKNLVSAS